MEINCKKVIFVTLTRSEVVRAIAEYVYKEYPFIREKDNLEVMTEYCPDGSINEVSITISTPIKIE